MEILASCSRISTFGIRLPQSLSGFPNARLTVYCRCFMVFLHYVIASAFGNPCTTKIQTISRTCNTKCENLTYLTQKLARVSQRKQAELTHLKLYHILLYHLLLTQNYENLKEKTYFHKPAFERYQKLINLNV